MRVWKIVVCVWGLGGAAGRVVGAVPPRHDPHPLNGRWEHQIVEDLDKSPPAGGWRGCTVPGYLRGVDYKRAWLRRRFTVPAAMKGRRIKIRFGGVKYNSRVLVNGRPVGGCFGGHRPFEVDVTNAVRFDRPNELLVGVHDWTGLFTPGKVDFSKARDWHQVRGMPRDKILAPIGGLYGLYGIWDDVTCVSHPAVYVKDLFIQPSVRRGELKVVYTLANESPRDAEATLSAAVEEAGKDVLRLPSGGGKIPAGKTVTVTLRQAWAKPRLWSHVQPHLYLLRTRLSTGDEVRTRFGFREFWADGPHFYLNGVKVNLLATSWWPPHAPMDRAEIERRWRAVKKAGCVAFRTHTQPWRAVHYDVADEVGLLMINEGAVWNDDYVYRIDDRRFWDHYAAHLRSMVQRDRNHPSIVMWSLENEFYGGRLNDESPAKKDLIRMGRLVKQCDPTRPILYESDGDPGGVADVIGIHYPHEYPTYTCWPNEAYWLRYPQKLGSVFRNGKDEFVWGRRKPLYVGEFLWLPSSDPSWHTVFFGDEAYRDYRRYRDRGKAESWKMQILGYRHLGVAGISPWTVIEGGKLDETNFLYQAHQYAYQHIAAYCHDYDRRFYSADEVTRRVEVFNDVMQPSKLALAWTLRATGKVVDRGAQALSLGPAEKRMRNVTLTMPKVTARTAATWRLTLARGGKQVFEDTHEYWVFPRAKLSAGTARLGLYDPTGRTRALLESHGLRAKPMASLAEIGDRIDVLVIGAGALSAGQNKHAKAPGIGFVSPARQGMMQFLSRGGRVLVLEQAGGLGGLFDVQVTGQKSTMTFPHRPSHPVLRGVRAGDLKFWRGDHVVAEYEPARPTSGGGVAIVVSGSASGINHAPLLELPVGRGCAILSQLKLVEKLEAEPAALRILGNCLAYLAAYKSPSSKTAVAGGSKEYRAYLRELGLGFDDLTGRLDDADLSGYALLVCRGKVLGARKLRDFVHAGGNVLLHRTPADGWEPLMAALKIPLTRQTYRGPVTRAEGQAPMLEAVAREDLYWLGTHRGHGWAETPRAAGMADAVLARKIRPGRARAFEVETWKLNGQNVSRQDTHVSFATVGSAETQIDFPADGTYTFGVVAGGTPCKGVWPVVRVTVDGTLLGTLEVSDRKPATYTVFGPVRKGRRKVAVAFVNDATDAETGEDRNVVIDKVLLAREDRTDVVFLTNPPAAAAARRGKGTVVLDQLRWDTELTNARKAARYACGLLTQLGASFVSRTSWAIECETMTPQKGMPHFRNFGTSVALACSGYVSRPVEVAAAGRYAAALVARGSSAQGGFPIVTISLGGKQVARVELTSSAWRAYAFAADLPKGRHDLRLTFTNDLNVAGEDRNLYLDKVLFYRDRESRHARRARTPEPAGNDGPKNLFTASRDPPMKVTSVAVL